MRRTRWPVALLVALVAGVPGCSRDGGHDERDVDDAPAVRQAQEPAGGVPKPVTLDAAEQARLGVVVAKLNAASAPSGTPTSARVLDPGPLLALDSELAAAVASLNASRAEADRTRKLFSEDRTASARAVENTDSQAQADRQRVENARRRIALEWGDGISSLPAEKRSALLNDLVQVRAELIRVEMPGGIGAPAIRSTVAVRERGDSPEVDATVLGTLPAADPRLQTRGLLVELRGPQARLPIGSMLMARIPVGGRPPGVVLPRSALIRKDSKVWAYVQTAPATFLRRVVTGYEPVSDGWFVHDGFAPGDSVVTAGAAAVFAVEAPAAAAD